MRQFENFDCPDIQELEDDMLEEVTGGVEVGDVVRVRNDNIEYCSRCARLIMNYEATITGIRGVLDGKIIYWVTRSCCGAKSSIIETSIQ